MLSSHCSGALGFPCPPGTSWDAAWSHLETPQKHRKRQHLTGKCLKQKVVPSIFQSSQATVLELWASPEVLGLPGTLLDVSCSHEDTPQTHRQRSHLTGKCLKQKVVPGLFQSSQDTILELWTSPELLAPPGTLLDVSCSHQDTKRQYHREQNFPKS